MGIEPIPRSPVGGRGFRSALVNAVRFGRYGSRVGRGPLTQGEPPDIGNAADVLRISRLVHGFQGCN
jgi:hypothetical protein